MENKEKKRGNSNLENQCSALMKIVRKLDTDDIERVVDITTGFALARETDVKKKPKLGT